MDIPGAQESAANSSNSSLGATLSTSQTERNKSGHIAAHRQSFAEDQRRPPPSPRSHRHPSLTQQAVQELMNHPPINRHANPQYAGRNWQEIAVGELAVADDVKWTDLDESVQDATLVCFLATYSNATRLLHADPSPLGRHSSKTIQPMRSLYERPPHQNEPSPRLTTAI